MTTIARDISEILGIAQQGDNIAVVFTALIGLATTMSGSLIGWIAKSPLTNGNGNGGVAK